MFGRSARMTNLYATFIKKKKAYKTKFMLRFRNENGGIQESVYFDFNTKKFIPMLKVEWTVGIKM